MSGELDRTGGAGRVFRTPEGRWRAFEAWRAPGPEGPALVYFLALEGEGPAPDDRRDLRASLEPGDRIEALEEEALRTLGERAVPLTETERRLVDAGGDVWLAQSVGPVWAEGEVASGLTAVRFIRLTGPTERREASGGSLGSLDAAELLELLERARPETDAGPSGRAEDTAAESG